MSHGRADVIKQHPEKGEGGVLGDPFGDLYSNMPCDEHNFTQIATVTSVLAGCYRKRNTPRSSALSLILF